ncbi:cytochrome-c peroxidase [Larkinella terrae]|uniref:cytochrome-c peroxidase n=1 Tax=Larkinella terrae TaxID=2025311 RepID=UPI001E57CCE9|nr:cytochrome c peroxidase [Larkinella terrae]
MKLLPSLFFFLGTTAFFVIVFGLLEPKSAGEKNAVRRVKQTFSRNLAAYQSLIHDRFLPLAEKSNSPDSLKTVFLAARREYKQLEPFTAYYFPASTRLVNGPPLPEVESEDGAVFEPGGLQVIEELIYPKFDPKRRPDLVRELKKLRRELIRYADFWRDTELTDAHVFDALRLQIFRMITLGISGFDTPLCQTAIPEAAVSLETIRTYLSFYENPETGGFESLNRMLQQSENYLHTHTGFDSFDRAHFITTFGNPLSANLLAYQQQINIQPFNEVRALRADAKTLFDRNAFNPDFYAPNVSLRSNPAKVILGKKLFSDPILSASDDPAGGKRSCASCHQPDKAFTDGLPKNATLNGRNFVRRNTPTLWNVGLQSGQFYDLRSKTLENQSSDVIHNKEEMHGSLERVALLLPKNNEYREAFKKAFPNLTDRIEPIHIQNALAAYERSLTSLNSRFDRYMRNERNSSGKPVLTAEELAGFNLFMGKARCGTCHFLPLFNGTVPPVFTQTESEVIGVPVRPGQKTIDPDRGRYDRFALEPLKYAFKTPTVRNIAMTAPYMHNGSFRTLEEVVEFYNEGGGKGLGIVLNNQTLSAEKLNLSPQEKTALIAFLKSLSESGPSASISSFGN